MAFTQQGEKAAREADAHEAYIKEQITRRDNFAYGILFEKWCKEHNIDISHKKNKATAFAVWRSMVETIEVAKKETTYLRMRFEMCEMGYEKQLRIVKEHEVTIKNLTEELEEVRALLAKKN